MTRLVAGSRRTKTRGESTPPGGMSRPPRSSRAELWRSRSCKPFQLVDRLSLLVCGTSRLLRLSSGAASAVALHLKKCHPSTAYQRSRHKMTIRSDSPPTCRAERGDVGAKVRYNKPASTTKTAPATTENIPNSCQPGARQSSVPTKKNINTHTSTTTADARL